MQLSSTVLLSVLVSLSSFTSAVPVSTKSQQNATKAPLQLNFNVVRYNSDAKNGTTKTLDGVRKSLASPVNLELENEYALYLAEMEIGTPGQKIKIDVDTGSSDLWVPAYNTTSNSGTFDARKSSTYKKLQDGFKIGYGDGSTALGVWASETVSLGGATVQDLRFGYATNQTAKQAIMGVGYTGNEASAWKDHNDEYDNFPAQLKKQGLINKNAYSLYLNSLDADAGLILFGAIDEAKYEGDLKLLDVVNIDDSGAKTDKPVAFFVNLDSIEQDGKSLASKTYPALLDSGTTLIYAPKDIATEFGKKYGHKIPFVDAYFTSCDKKGEDFEFKFGDKTIKVPFKSLLYHINGKKDKTFLNQCLIGVMGTTSDYYILGDAFLRSAYVHYDLEANKVGVAQVKYTTDSNIKLV